MKAVPLVEETPEKQQQQPSLYTHARSRVCMHAQMCVKVIVHPPAHRINMPSVQVGALQSSLAALVPLT